jgi:hypothetical protein
MSVMDENFDWSTFEEEDFDMPEFPPEKYDIVWYAPQHAERAVCMVKLLPANEHKRRGKTHHFRMWESVPGPKGGKLHCITTDRLGSAMLNPGAISNGRPCILDLCIEPPITNNSNRELKIGGEIPIELEPNLFASDIKAAVWDDPLFQKAAQEQEFSEQEAIKKIVAMREKQQAEFEAAGPALLRRFLVMVANMTMRSGARNPSEMTNEELQDVYIAAQLTGATLPTIQDWLAELMPAPPLPEQAQGSYDPKTFLAHQQRLRAAVQR